MIRKMIFGMALLVACPIFMWGQNSAADLLAAAGDKEGEEKVETLEKAVELAEKESFDEVARKGYVQLIKMYESEDKVAQELKTRIQFLNYLSTKTDDKKGEAEAEYGIGKLYLEERIYEKAAERFRSARLLAQEIGDNNLTYKALKNYGWSHHQQGNSLQYDGLGGSMKNVRAQIKSAYRNARNAYEQLLDLAEQSGRQSEQLWTRQQLARVTHAEGNYQEEMRHHKESLRLAKRLKKSDAVIKSLNNLGYVSKYLEQDEAALSYFEQALAELKFKPDAATEADVLLNMGVILHNLGKSFDAVETLEEAGRKASQAGQLEQAGNAYDFLALVYFQKKDEYNALEYNKESVRIAEENKLPDLLLKSYNTRSLIYKSLYEFEYALAAQKRYLDVKDSLADLRQSDLNSRRLKEREMQANLERMLELQRLKLKDELAEEEKRRLEKELELSSSLEERSRLEAANAQDQLALAQQKNRIANLDRLRLLKDIQLRDEQARADAEKLAADEERRKAADALDAASKAELQMKLEESLKKEQMLVNEQQRENIRNLTLILIGGGLLMLIILLTLLQLRVRNRKIKRQQVVIAAEKQKSDDLLLNILPAAVADELKESGAAKPRQYEEATVLFTDFVGFTMISEKLSPAELVQTLDKIFLEFDLIVERNGLQRIKTIGDAYMAACGIPDPDPEHAAKAVNAAIEMRDFIRKFNAGLPEGLPPWNIRIGLNSGSLVAGVVGIRKFAYDIWGDTVNTASRMESSGEPGKVNISGTTRNLLKGKFQLEYRGKVKAKNKGEIDMYFVEST